MLIVTMRCPLYCAVKAVRVDGGLHHTVELLVAVSEYFMVKVIVMFYNSTYGPFAQLSLRNEHWSCN
jgi:hypothetical protein